MNNKICGECCHLDKTEGFSFFKCKHCDDAVSSSNTACNHFSKQYGICPECGSYLFSYEHTENNDWRLCICDRCGCSGTPDEFLYDSVFARITASIETLAETLVYCAEPERFCETADWRSVILGNVSFATRSQVIAAAVAKLKEELR